MAKFVKTKNEIKDIYVLIRTYHSTGHKKRHLEIQEHSKQVREHKCSLNQKYDNNGSKIKGPYDLKIY